MEDWDTLFNAAVGRLQAGVDSCNAVAPLHRLESWARIRAQVLECVEALDQLHLTAYPAERCTCGSTASPA